jgi:hypothetical protein
MSRDQIIFLFVAAGLLAYVYLPTILRRVRAWFAPEPLAPWRYPGGDR